MWAGIKRLWSRFDPEGRTGKVVEKVIVPLTVAVVGVLASLATYYGQQRAEEERSPVPRGARASAGRRPKPLGDEA
jgi:hypothetical protein